MTLYSVESDEPIRRVPHEGQFDEWKDRLGTESLAAINAEFDQLISAKLDAGTEVLTSSWLPEELSPDGSQEWSRTPFFKIWEVACHQNWEQTGWCFGLLLWEHMMQRPVDWCYIKQSDDGFQGTRYFLRRS